MKLQAFGLAVAATLAVTAVTGPARAATDYVTLGASTETFTLYGMGETSPGSGVGTFTVGQGASTFDGATSTFTLSGAITGGSPGYDSGTYAFVTTYTGANAPTAGPNAPTAQSNPFNTNEFYYTGLDPSTTITLDLFTPGGNYVEPLVTGGSFVAGTGFSFQFVNTNCTGVPFCGQNEVGITPGSSIYGPVTLYVDFPAVPEPAAWALMLVGLGAVGAAMRSRRGLTAA
jgi:uncharacterized membrane protein